MSHSEPPPPTGSWLAALRELILADPVRFAVRAGFVLGALAVVGWDLPSSFSWENDGLAPRDIFAGIGENLRPGHAFRYPLLHPALLGLLCLPVLLPAAAGAASASFTDLRAAVLAPAVMTTCTLIGRLVAILAAVIALGSLGRITTRLAGRAAGRWAEAFAATNLSFVYYGRATNLDGPALMWSALAVEHLLEACTRARPGDATRFALFAAASIATKDQSYATYALIIPAVIALRRWHPGAFAPGAWSRRAALEAGAVFVATYGIASGAVFNPSGFATRVRTLLGPASGDYRAYERTLAGLAANLRDVLCRQAETFWPWPVVALAWLGVGLAAFGPLFASRTRSRPWTDGPWRLLPLGAALGGLGAFVLAVGRTDHRFVLSFGFWLSCYAGMAMATLVSAADGMGRVTAPPSLRTPIARLARLAGIALLVGAALPAVALGATQWGDGRRQVEGWLRRLPPGATVETYGPLAYLPRFDQGGVPPYRASRIGADPIARRNPLEGLKEIEDTLDDVEGRQPDVIVVSEGFAIPYLANGPPAAGHVLPVLWQREREARGGDILRFVRAAVSDNLAGYQLCLIAEPRMPWWMPFSPRRIHVSSGARTWILGRQGRVACDARLTPAAPTSAP